MNDKHENLQHNKAIEQLDQKEKSIQKARQAMHKESEKIASDRAELDALKKELDRREKTLTRDRELLDEQSKALELEKAKSDELVQRQKKQKSEILKQRRQIDACLEKQDERERVLEEREKELELREQDRLAGYPELTREFEKRLAEVRAEIEEARTKAVKQAADHRKTLLSQTQQDLESHEKLVGQLSDKHRKKIEALHLKEQELLEAHYKSLKKSADENMSRLKEEQEARLAELDTTRKQLSEQASTLHEREVTLKADQERLELQRKGLETREELLDRDRAQIDATVAARWQTQIQGYETRINTVQSHLEEVRADLELARRTILAHDTLRHRLGDREPSEILGELRALRQDNQRLHDDLSNRISSAEEEDLRRQAERAADALAELEQERHAHHLLRQQHERQEAFLHELEREREKALRFEGLAESRRTICDGLSEEINRLTNVFERDIVRERRAEALERVVLEPPTEVNSVEDESQWLQALHNSMTSAQFEFPRRLLWSFHTALKSAEASPLTVLAGVSGTGKSKLPELYGRFGGIPFLSVPVDPSWDSPQSLLGYFNAVDNQFDATDILCALVQSQRESTDQSGLRDAMVMILLDEMNLAHVELYFSDMLSKLEERRGKACVELGVSLGAGVDPFKLELGRNVLWLGTMNEDETTTALSDKVIDRGNILHFPRPRTFARSQNALLNEQAVPLLPRQTWEKWSRPIRPFKEDEIQDFKSLLEEVNRYMGEAGRALGHRVWQSVERYMGNHPDVRLRLAAVDEAQDEEKDMARQQLRDAMKIAFEDQLVLKVMPKLRGIDTSGSARSRCLEPIAATLSRDGIATGLSEDYERAMRVGHGVFVWHTAEYLLADGGTHG